MQGIHWHFLRSASLFETVEEAFARVIKQSTYGIGTANAASLDEKESRKEEQRKAFGLPYQEVNKGREALPDNPNLHFHLNPRCLVRNNQHANAVSFACDQ